ncbi:hypothetical protein FVE85_9710 [Porphyridium purpureum]|uniref:Glycosyltransferase n=1 Tax=Porphyridium purpureum TaxID=35688 RepID=A0A5J4YLY1_PORPP|nr:hypothetical protein FVE85_9710 [Porphyridium purpureum]|eukprot:POR0521..scf246_12
MLEASGVRTYRIAPNRRADLDVVLQAAAPDVVVFDRFMAEEAFSFRVRAVNPDAIRILDMQDLHSLRYTREKVVKQALATKDDSGCVVQSAKSVTRSPVEAALASVPAASDDRLCRELASVHRCDLTLVCSPVEMSLMRDRFQIPSHKLVLASLFCKPPVDSPLVNRPGFEGRAGFMTIGTFLHPPNVDSVRWLASEVWPLIRARLPNAEMHVFGAYPTEAMRKLHSHADGFLVQGFARSVPRAMEAARVMLAPLRFGAGIKGKIVDAWANGLPVVTTPVGAEGMVPGVDWLWRPQHDADDGEWGGRWGSVDAEGVASDALLLHEDPEAWEKARARGVELVATLFPAEPRLAILREQIERLFRQDDKSAKACLAVQRNQDFVGAMLWHHSVRSTEYFSRWIELKETGVDSSRVKSDTKAPA